jgi:hypothetical protein
LFWSGAAWLINSTNCKPPSPTVYRIERELARGGMAVVYLAEGAV